ncbi:MAG: MerR family transcriptional regulator [Methylocystaceae bacterium]|nr:MerR family transcriptional regulator [Methylocystaceae bacterium]
MEKTVNAFRSISEAATELDIPQHVLRFWETRFSQIKPMKRGGGRRFYRADDIELLRAIRHLLYGEGYTIKGVQRLLKENGQKAVIALALSGGTRPLAGPGGRDYLASDDLVFQAPLNRTDSSGYPETAALAAPGGEEEGAERYGAIASAHEGQHYAAPARQSVPGHISHEASHASGEHSGSPVWAEDVRPQLLRALEELEECRRILNAAA